MTVYLASLAAGILVGVIYSLLNVRSPAPPVIALIGLLGILAGEQLPPLVKNLWSGPSAPHAWLDPVNSPGFGALPKAQPTPGILADTTRLDQG